MSDQVLIIVSIILFLLVGLMSKNKKNNSIEGFSTKKNTLSWFVTSAGVSMTFVGGAALINMASLGYSFGWYTLVDPIALIIGIVISILFINWYRQDNGVTISQLLSSKNKVLSLYIGVISSIIFLLITAAQFVAFSKLLAPYFPSIHPTLLILIPSTIILLYVILGGFSAVTYTDVLQLFFIFIFLILPVLFFIFSKDQLAIGVKSEKTAFPPMPLDLIILLCISIFFIPISQDINVRAKSAKNKKHAIVGLAMGAFFYTLIVVACSFIGIRLAQNGIKLDDVEEAFPMFFKYYFPSVGIFAILSGMAAIWSTLDTYLVNGITSVAEDILKKNRYFKEISERRLIVITALLVFILAMLAGIYFNQVLSLILTALLIYISIILPIVFARWQRINDAYILIISFVILVAIVLVEIFNVNINPKAVLYPSFGIGLMFLGKLAKPKL